MIANSSELPSIAFPAGASPVAKPGKVDEAARQFESMLLAQILRSGRESADDLGGDDADSESSTMLDVAEQQFAKLLADHGGIGLTRLISQSLKQSAAKD